MTTTARSLSSTMLLLSCVMVVLPMQAWAQAGERLAHPPDAPPRGDQLEVRRQDTLLQLSWRDAEDVLEGAVLPAEVEAGQPVKVSVRIGTIQGAPFDGPVSVTLRPVGDTSGETKVVTREGERWLAELTPRTAGRHVISVGFRTSRHKVLHGEMSVLAAPLPRALAWVSAAVLVIAVVGVGAFRLMRKNDAEKTARVGG